MDFHLRFIKLIMYNYPTGGARAISAGRKKRKVKAPSMWMTVIY